jgi:antitoxin (DNA-binding transcriptional repressor) of toxin-antitoxin stability system
MKTKPATQIGMREFLRNIKSVKTAVGNGEEFEVLDHATPVFKVVPTKASKSHKYTFADLSQFQFNAGPKTLAADVDGLVYGN